MNSQRWTQEELNNLRPYVWNVIQKRTSLYRQCKLAMESRKFPGRSFHSIRKRIFIQKAGEVR